MRTKNHHETKLNCKERALAHHHLNPINASMTMGNGGSAAAPLKQDLYPNTYTAEVIFFTKMIH